MAPTPETSSSVGVLEGRGGTLRFRRRFKRWISWLFWTWPLWHWYSNLIILCMFFYFNVFSSIVSFVFWILLSCGHVVACVKPLHTPRSFVFCMFQTTYSFQQPLNSKVQTDTCWHVVHVIWLVFWWNTMTHRFPHLITSAFLRCCLINRACWMKNSRCEHSIGLKFDALPSHPEKLPNADQKWWILDTILLCIVIVFFLFLYIYILYIWVW